MQQQPAHPAIFAAITVARSLDEPHFQQLVAALDNATLPLTSGVLQVQRLLHFSSAESRTIVNLLRFWQEWGKDIQALTIALQAVRATSAIMRAEASSVSLVWTGPVSLPGSTRATGSTLVDLIDHAQQEIIIVGYTLAVSARRIIERLAQAQQRGVQVVLIVDRMEENKLLPVLKSCWYPDQELPLLYTRQASSSDPKSALHAKAVIVDSHSILATSANLSYHGLAGNIELGLLVEGKVAWEAVSLLKSLITEEICVPVDASEGS
jgi:phosphatidylserine/phosphatidylglycerophosphate/cardiolipin synthase-like enzyme